MGFSEILRALATAVNEREAAKAFGVDWRERKAATLADTAERARKTHQAGAEWTAKLRAAQDLYPGLSPEDALAKQEAEDVGLAREVQRAVIGLRGAQAFHAMQPPRELADKGFDTIESGGRIYGFNKTTGEKGADLGPGKPERAPTIQIVQTPEGYAAVPKVLGGKPVAVPGVGGGGQLQPKPTEGSMTAAGQLADMYEAVKNLDSGYEGIKGKLGILHGAGPRAAVGEFLGSDPELVAYRNEAQRLFNMVYVNSGKQINERTELPILKSYLPRINQDAGVFFANLQRFKRGVEAIISARRLGRYLSPDELRQEAEGGGSNPADTISPNDVFGLPGGQQLGDTNATKTVGGVTYRKVAGGWQRVQ